MKRLSRTFALFALMALTTSAGAADLPEAGAAFPTWSLQDHRGKTISSSDLAGSSYVLWFYPKAMTPGCTVEGKAFRDSHPAFETAGVKIFGVSFDTPAENAQFAEAEGFPYPLLSDEKRELAMAVGAASSPTAGYARRISFLVGPDGKVIKAYSSVSPSGHAAEVLGDIPD